jgi:hypothetical protein
MKTKLSILFVLLLVFTGGLNIAEAQNRAVGKKVRGEPFTEARYRSDKKSWRAVGNAQSVKLDVSKEKALLIAKQRLAGFINTEIKSVTDRYLNSLEAGGKEEINSSFEVLTREVINQTIANTVVMGEEVRFIKKGKIYNAYTAIEVNKEEFQNALTQKLSNSDRLRLRFDKSKFEQIYNQEMQKFGEQNAPASDSGNE